MAKLCIFWLSIKSLKPKTHKICIFQLQLSLFFFKFLLWNRNAIKWEFFSIWKFFAFTWCVLFHWKKSLSNATVQVADILPKSAVGWYGEEKEAITQYKKKLYRCVVSRQATYTLEMYCHVFCFTLQWQHFFWGLVAVSLRNILWLCTNFLSSSSVCTDQIQNR